MRRRALPFLLLIGVAALLTLWPRADARAQADPALTRYLATMLPGQFELTGATSFRNPIPTDLAQLRATAAVSGIYEGNMKLSSTIDVHRVSVGGRVNRNGTDAELLAGAQHPKRDLAAVGDEDFVEHGFAANSE